MVTAKRQRSREFDEDEDEGVLVASVRDESVIGMP
jgi:hypothetical protein